MKTLVLKKNIQNSFFAYLIIIPTIFFISFFGTLCSSSLNSIMFGFLISYAYTVIFSIRYFGFLSLYCIFLYISAFFVYDCFFFTLFCGENFLFQEYPIRYYFDEKIGLIFIISSYLSIYVMHITYCLYNKRKCKSMKPIYTEKNMNKIGKCIMIIFFIPLIVKLMIQFNYVRTHGYISIYNGELASLTYPFWTAGAFMIFISGYALFLSSNPPKKEFFLFTVIYFFIVFADSLKGVRGTLISTILFCVYYYTKHYDVKFSFRKILFIFFIVIFLVVMLGTVRTSFGAEDKSKQKIDVGELVVKIIYGQTTTRAVPMLIIRGNLNYHNYPFVFSPIINLITHFFITSDDVGHTETIVQRDNGLGDLTMYNVSKSAYLAGYGYGGAFLAEAYDFFRFFGVILFSFIFARVFAFFDFSKLNVKRIYIPILFFFLPTIFILPRSSMLFFFAYWNRIIFSYILFFLVKSASYMFKCQRSEKI